MKIAVGSDHAGYELKRHICLQLTAQGYDVLDKGTQSDKSVDYPDYAKLVGQHVASGECQVGLLVCGTGLGMAIAANKIPGVKAIVCSDTFSARMGREHNDANILCIGSRVVGAGLAMDIVTAFLNGQFLGGRHTARVQKIDAIEAEFLKR